MCYNNIFETMVNGKITSILLDFFFYCFTTFTLEGHDLSFDYMKRCSPERTFIDQPYSDIAKTIAKEAKLTPVVDDTGKYKPSRRKDNDENYFVFLKRLAEEVSYRFDVDRDIMYFRNKEDVNKELLLLEMEKDIIRTHKHFIGYPVVIRFIIKWLVFNCSIFIDHHIPHPLR